MLALLLCTPIHSFARTFHPVGSTNGLEARVVPALLIDQDGFLWVGSREGLFRYDGYETTSFVPDSNNPHAISDTDIRVLYETPDGNIWVGSNTGGLNRFEPHSGRFEVFRHDSSDPDSLLDDAVYGLSHGPADGIWVASNEGLSRMDRQTGKFKHFLHDPDDESSLSHKWAYAVYLSPAGNLWVSTVGGGVNRWNPETGTFARFDLASLAGGPQNLNDVFALYEDDNGILWAGTREGLARLDPATGEARTLDLGKLNGYRPVITSIVFHDGRLWLATMTRGILVVDLAIESWTTASDKPLGSDGYLPAQPQMSLVHDGRLLFVGTWGSGVYRATLDDDSFVLIGGSSSGLTNSTISSVLATAEPGQPWAGTFGGGPQRVSVADRAAGDGPSRDEPLHLAGVMDMLETTDGKLYAATTKGLFEFDNSGSQVAHYENDPEAAGSIASGYVTALLEGTRNGLWVGVSGGGLNYLDRSAGHFTQYIHHAEMPDSISGDSITALLRADEHHIWVGTRSHGLNLCRTEPFSCERFPGGSGAEGELTHFHVTALYADRRGRIWVATNGGGLNRVLFDDSGNVAGFESWGRANGLLSDGIMAIEEDLDESLWLSTRHGLSRFNPATGGIVNHIAESGLPTSHFDTNASDQDEAFIYFGSVDGLLAIRKGSLLSTRRPSAVRVTSVDTMSRGSSERVARPTDQALNVPYGDIIAVEMATMDYSEGAHEYAYRMNVDEPWIDLGSQRQIIFYGLAPGDYAFQARGRDVYGLIAESPVLDLEIIPPLWMRRWFQLMAAGLFIVLGVALHLVRQRALKRRARELMRLGATRERALENRLGSQAELAVLTPRQKEILQLIAEGRSTRDIAELLDVSIKTVQAHRANLMERLEIEDFAGLVRLAVRTGLVSPED